MFWVAAVNGVPTDAHFALTGGEGTAIVIDHTTHEAYYLHPVTKAVTRLGTAGAFAVLVGGNTFQGAQIVTPTSLSIAAGAIATDASDSNNFEVVLTANCTLSNPTNLVDGGIYNWRIEQDGTGGWALSFDSKFIFPGGLTPAVSAAAGAVDLLVGQYFATDDKILAVLTSQFASSPVIPTPVTYYQGVEDEGVAVTPRAVLNFVGAGVTAADSGGKTTVTIPGGVTDHGGLAGLGDDDHSQYHNDARGDARYSALGHTHTVYNQTVEDEGTPVTQRSSVNFTGAGVSVSDVGGKTTVSIPGGAGEAFPVGSVFIAVVSTNPATLLGYGTWSAFGAGRVLVGLDSGDTDFDAVEETGGAKTVASAGSNAAEAAHTHTYSQVLQHTHTVNITDPGHDHTTQRYPTATGGSSGFTADTSMSGTPTANTLTTQSNTTGISATTSDPGGSVASGTTAAGSSHNHAFTGSATSVVQPYIVVYMWKRTA